MGIIVGVRSKIFLKKHRLDFQPVHPFFLFGFKLNSVDKLVFLANNRAILKLMPSLILIQIFIFFEIVFLILSVAPRSL